PLSRCAAHVLAAGGIAIHGGVGPGGDVDGAHDVFGEHTVERVVEGHPERRLAAHVVQDATRRLGGRERRGHGSSACACSSVSVARSWSHMVSWNRTTLHAASKSKSSVTMATQRPASGDPES